MTVADRLKGADPTDLVGLREALGMADPKGRLTPIGIGRIEIGADVLSLLPGVASELARGPRVVLATDAAPIRRADSDPKAEVERLLAKRFEVRRAVLGEGRTQLRADEEALSEVEALVTGPTVWLRSARAQSSISARRRRRGWGSDVAMGASHFFSARLPTTYLPGYAGLRWPD
jgi:hypothetical protein